MRGPQDTILQLLCTMNHSLSSSNILAKKAVQVPLVV